MTLQERLKEDLIYVTKCGDITTKSILRVVLGEISRYPNKEVSDDEVIKILRKIIKDEKETLKLSLDKGFTHQLLYQVVLMKYLPKEIGDEEVKQWIEDNIDFDEFDNKMQAMKPIMAHFGSSVNGNKVKQILVEKI